MCDRARVPLDPLLQSRTWLSPHPSSFVTSSSGWCTGARASVTSRSVPRGSSLAACRSKASACSRWTRDRCCQRARSSRTACRRRHTCAWPSSSRAARTSMPSARSLTATPARRPSARRHTASSSAAAATARSGARTASATSCAPCCAATRGPGARSRCCAATTAATSGRPTARPSHRCPACSRKGFGGRRSSPAARARRIRATRALPCSRATTPSSRPTPPPSAGSPSFRRPEQAPPAPGGQRRGEPGAQHRRGRGRGDRARARSDPGTVRQLAARARLGARRRDRRAAGRHPRARAGSRDRTAHGRRLRPQRARARGHAARRTRPADHRDRGPAAHLVMDGPGPSQGHLREGRRDLARRARRPAVLRARCSASREGDPPQLA